MRNLHNTQRHIPQRKFRGKGEKGEGGRELLDEKSATATRHLFFSSSLSSPFPPSSLLTLFHHPSSLLLPSLRPLCAAVTNPPDAAAGWRCQPQTRGPATLGSEVLAKAAAALTHYSPLLSRRPGAAAVVAAGDLRPPAPAQPTPAAALLAATGAYLAKTWRNLLLNDGLKN